VTDKNAGGLHTTDFDFIKEWAVIHKIDIGAKTMKTLSEKVIARIQEEIDLLNENLEVGEN
jgi:long-chain acyl-CoA synthetase